MPKTYMVCFRGQFGILFSYGVDLIAKKAREKFGLTAEVYNYGQAAQILDRVHWFHSHGYRTIGLGYSLGVSALTWTQWSGPRPSNETPVHYNLLLAIAGSKLGSNYKINRAMTERSVLWRNPNSTLSGAGAGLGFDIVHDLPGRPHLWMDFDPIVVNGVMEEIQNLA